MNDIRQSALSLRESALAIFLLSVGLLTVEITFTRLFSFAISYHFAYLTIATALLGFGSAGSVLAAYPALWGDERRRVVLATALSGVATVLALAYGSVVRFNPLTVSSDPTSMATLASYYIVVAVPFFFGGLAVSTILAARPDKIGKIYAADLVGAGLGCALSVPLIWAVETPVAVTCGAAMIAASGLVAARDGLRRIAFAGLAASIVIGLAASALGPFPPSPGKFLSSFLASPGAQHIFQQWTPLSRVDAVGWERGENTWRGSYADSGVSERFTGRGPEYRMIGYDGGSFAVMYEFDGDPDSLDMFDGHLMAAPYKLKEAPRTLIIGLGGGADALAGIANGAGPMTAVELNPVTVRLGREEFSDFNGGLFNSDRLDVVADEARHWVRSTDERFDLIVLNSIDTLSALSSGAYVLAESYLYTVEAFRDYLSRLKPGGMYALYAFDNNGLAGPTFIIVRFATTLVRSLAELGIDDAASHIVVLATEGNVPFVGTFVKREPFTVAEMATLDQFAATNGFHFWQRPDRKIDHPVANYLWADPEQRAAFVRDHELRFDPATDVSPFFFNFYKWATILDPGRSAAATATPATGQRMLFVMVVQALFVATAMILWPLRRLSKQRPITKPLGVVAYFGSLGLGFIFFEISLLQRFVLFLGFPTYSLSIVLFCLLVFAGLGSAASERLVGSPAHNARRLSLLVPALAVLVWAFVPMLFEHFLSAPLATRVAISMVVLAPIGVVLGMFFPLGVRVVEGLDSRLIPWAWAINGCTTVVGTIVAVILAMAYGFDVVMFCAAAIYVAGASALVTVPSTAR